MKGRYLKARLTAREYQSLRDAADGLGVSISEHARQLLTKHREALEQSEFLATLETRLTNPRGGGANLEPLITEVLLLVRELVAVRDAQVTARVARQLDQLYPQRKK